MALKSTQSKGTWITNCLVQKGATIIGQGPISCQQYVQMPDEIYLSRIQVNMYWIVMSLDPTALSSKKCALPHNSPGNTFSPLVPPCLAVREEVLNRSLCFYALFLDNSFI